MKPIDAIALVGPTASGKTAAALALADALQAQGGAEIISVDSALVYRGMDIGTAKPSRAERTAVPHHLIDILDPLERYSAADFARDAARLIGEIRARGRMPLIVGGTLLYLKALLEGLSDMPAADAQVRTEIQQRALELGWPALHAQLQAVDPVTAARLAPNDSQRIGRALEELDFTWYEEMMNEQSSASYAWLAQQLEAAGAQVDEVAAYCRTLPAWGEAERALLAQAVQRRGKFTGRVLSPAPLAGNLQ